MRKTLEHLYFGSDLQAIHFRYGLLTFDILTVVFFVVSSLAPDSPTVRGFEYVVAIGISVDYLARLWIARRRLAYVLSFGSLVDIVVIASLVVPLFFENWAFLRVVRALRILRSYQLLKDMRGRSRWFARNEEVIVSSVNLAVFVFLITALVYVLEAGDDSPIRTYMDALYFTIATLTTTGFGDITLQGTYGRLLAIFIMVAGVALFLRLVQTIFRPAKVRYTCPDCGLSRHDTDAIHCKHCGRMLNIESEGR